MVRLHLAVPALLATAVAAGCLSYLIAPLERVETVMRLAEVALNLPAPNRRASTRVEGAIAPKRGRLCRRELRKSCRGNSETRT